MAIGTGKDVTGDPYASRPSDWMRQYVASPQRYVQSDYRRCGQSGLHLPPISIGCWRSFGDWENRYQAREIVLASFDRGITHFDLANNYGRPPGSAESAFGALVDSDLSRYRDELVISTKAGYDMWPGPYGEGGSKKYIRASLDASLRRMKVDYVDIFYSHRYDPTTPLEETAAALEYAIDSGKALYVGISSYPPKAAKEIIDILAERRVRTVAYQGSYSMLSRWSEDSMQPNMASSGVGFVAFSVLAQGLLVSQPRRDRRRETIPKGAELKDVRELISVLRTFAHERSFTLESLAIAWALRLRSVTTAVLGVSSVEQLDRCLAGLDIQDEAVDEFANILDRETERRTIKNTDSWEVGTDG